MGDSAGGWKTGGPVGSGTYIKAAVNIFAFLLFTRDTFFKKPDICTAVPLFSRFYKIFLRVRQLLTNNYICTAFSLSPHLWYVWCLENSNYDKN